MSLFPSPLWVGAVLRRRLAHPATHHLALLRAHLADHLGVTVAALVAWGPPEALGSHHGALGPHVVHHTALLGHRVVVLA